MRCPIAGGTDLMVELNFDRVRPRAILDLTRIPELTDWGPDNGRLRVGAGVTYARLIDELGDRLPGLAIAARTVGSPQIRNRGTVGGNLGTSSPAGDGLPPLFASDAEIELASSAGTRRIAVREFVTGPKRNCLADDELIAAFHIAPADGPQQFAKIGTRNAMVIAVCSLALSIWPSRRRRGRLHRLRRSDTDPLRRRRRASSPGCSTSTTCGAGAHRFQMRHWPTSASSSSVPRGRSTTCAGAPATAIMRSACSDGGR